jgi:hypothetical protein
MVRGFGQDESCVSRSPACLFDSRNLLPANDLQKQLETIKSALVMKHHVLVKRAQPKHYNLHLYVRRGTINSAEIF